MLCSGERIKKKEFYVPFCFASQVNFSSSLDSGSGSVPGSGPGSGSGGSFGSTAGCQSPLPLLTLSPIIHPRIREFRSGLSSARKGGPSPPAPAAPGAVLTASHLRRRASFSAVAPRALRLSVRRQRQAPPVWRRAAAYSRDPGLDPHLTGQEADDRPQQQPEDRRSGLPGCPRRPDSG